MRDRIFKRSTGTACLGALLHFLRARDGTVALIFGLTFLPIIAAVGAAFDYSRVARANTVLTTSCDAAALAAGTRFDEPDFNHQAFAQDYMEVNSGQDWAFNATPQIQLLSRDGRTMRFRATAQMDTVLMGLMGIDKVDLRADCEITREITGIELVMVLDNTGSMSSNSKMTNMKQAARDLVETLFKTDGSVDGLRVGLVPFSDFVNIKATNRNWKGDTLDWSVNTAYAPTDARRYTGAAWQMIDTTGIAPWNGDYVGPVRYDPLFQDANNDGWDDRYPVGTASDDTTMDKNRGRNLDNFYFGADNAGNLVVRDGEFVPCNSSYATKCKRVPAENSHLALYDRLGITWQGCVESRPARLDGVMLNLDILDTPPDSDDPRTLFVPSFNTDGDGNGYDSWMSERDEFGSSSVTVTETYRDWWGRLRTRNVQYSTLPGSRYDRPFWMNKYYWRDHDAVWDTSGYRGPNRNCPPPITLLTNRKQDLLDAIDDMGPYFSTNIPEGVAWGWRMLSPDSPFGDANPYNYEDEKGHIWKKALIILTDGDNYTSSRRYNSYGYYEDDKRLTDPTGESDPRDAMDERLKSLCGELKTAGKYNPFHEGIRVYTIAFEMAAGETQRMFENCASTPEFFFDASNGDALKEAFERIGADLTALRLTH